MNILFMCVANSARSQMAEGLARFIFPNAKIASAGSNPTKPNPWAVLVMREMGINITHHYSKTVDDLPPEFIENLDYVITLCAEEVCPVLITKKAKKLHWPFKDPDTHGKVSDDGTVALFRDTRDKILARLRAFKSELE